MGPLPGFTTPGIPAKIQWELHGTGPVSATSFSPDGTRILLASGQDVHIFDAESGVRPPASLFCLCAVNGKG